MAASFMNSENNVKKIYQTVIDEVLTNIREAFLDEGYDEQLLQELKQMWESKLNASRALQSNEEPTSQENLRLPINQQSSSKETSQTSSRNAPNSGAASNTNKSQTHASAASNDVKPTIDPATRAAFAALPPQLSAANNSEKLKKQQQQLSGAQLDGGVDGSSSEDEDDEIAFGIPNVDEEDDDKTNNDDPSEYEGKEDPDSLNSADDLTEHGSPDSNSDLFDTENVIVCQYDKITRIKNKWKFHLKDGIMNINGKDYLFSKATGDAEW